NFQAAYHHQEQYYNWQAKATFENKKINWYGLPEPELILHSTSFIENLKPKQQYQTIGIDGKIDFKAFFLEDVKAGIFYFKDDFSSNEIQLFAKTGLSFPISTEKINVEADVDLIKGKFDKAYNSLTDLEHSFLKFGLNPSFEVLRENFKLNLGVNLTYSFDLEHRESKLYSYPNVYASYKLMDDLLIPFMGVTGELKTNSYKNMVEKNPFVSPTLEIYETDQTYNAFLGIKGNLSNALNYQLKTSYIKEKNKPMFLLNQNKTNGILPLNYGYEAGNSFGLIYDDVITFEIEGDLNLALTDEFSLKGNLVYSHYDTHYYADAFNLPTYKTTLSADYQTQKWFANSAIYLVGDTNDVSVPYTVYVSQPTYNPFNYIIKNKAYIEVDFNVGYHFSNRLTAFAKVNNLLNGNHQPFAHYKVQGLQAIAGITYKFDL
ncbi:MAG: TonB-dependent receptor, partial [Flavobacteriaceae bacterium]|nr:TonB-dependent receptor [Flavobacteriaceae bacterium]